MRGVIAGLLLVVGLGCGGLLGQSFDQGFAQMCLDDHASQIAELTDRAAACACAKASIEADHEGATDRLAALVDRAQMRERLLACNAPEEPVEAAEPEAGEPEEPEEVDVPEAPAP
ncbi:MAG: hypothetical protein AAF602_32630 [Myxococcota bacterium]